MSNKFTRTLSLILALALCAALLVGCGKYDEPEPTAEPTEQAFDPAAYVKGGLDAVYLGEYSDEYIAMLGGETKDSCAERYERGMQVSLEVFCTYFGIKYEQCSESVRTELMELMRKLYKCAKYEIGTPEQSGEGYTVEVKVSPIAAVAQTAQEDYPDFAKGAAERIASGELDKGSQSFIDWWAKSIHDMVNAHLVSPDYLDAQAVTVTLEKNSGGSFAFSGTSLADVDALIVSYPA